MPNCGHTADEHAAIIRDKLSDDERAYIDLIAPAIAELREEMSEL